MTLRPKLLIDVCVAPRASDKIVNFYTHIYPSLRIVPLIEIYRQNRSDAVWVKSLALEGGWIVVSADKGKDRKKPRLPQLCRDYRVTCVIMSSSLQNKGSATHQEVLHAILENIMPIYKAPGGTVISIGQIQEKGGLVRFAFRINRPKRPQISLSSFLETPNS